jgi:hypothetical protein
VAPRYNSQLKTFSPPHPEPRLPGSSVLYCSAHELALFGMFHLKAQHPRQKAILSDAAIDRLQEPAVAAGNRRQSLAWSITDNQHGYRTLLAQGGTSCSTPTPGSAWGTPRPASEADRRESGTRA